MTSWDGWRHDPCCTLHVYPTSFRTTGEAMTFVSERIGAALAPFVAQVQCACVYVVCMCPRVPRAYPRAKEFIPGPNSFISYSGGSRISWRRGVTPTPESEAKNY